MTDQSSADGTVLHQIHTQQQQPVTSYQTNQIQYGEYSQYAGVGGTTAYYQPPSTTIDGIPAQVITSDDHAGAAAYLVQTEALDGEGTPLSHTTRALPATVSLTVQWLIDNYETAEGVSLPRGTLYNHYLRHCHEHSMDPMNPASFGKLIRSVFLGLRTRRLGTRGNSKYHYYGIRIKSTSSLNQFTDDSTIAMRQTPNNIGKRPKSFSAKSEAMEHESGVHGSSSMHDTTQHQHQQFLGDPSCAIPNFVKIETCEPLPEVITQKDLDLFEIIYKEHCEAILDVVVNLQFTLVENLWRSFWRNPEVQTHSDIQLEKRYPKDKLFTICKYEPVKVFIKRSDYAFYQSLVEVLIPDVLRPIPSSLTQAIRNFAKSLEGWLKSSMEMAPDDMFKAKNGAVTAFAQTLRRYTSLNHLAQAARAVLQNTSQINQMLTDLNRVDFANVQEQASWVCQCDDQIVSKFEQDFKKTLQQQNSLEQWAIWLEGVVNDVLKHQEGTSFTKSARQFLLKWSFYSSMVIRDLTLRSAASFGSFHLIRLLYDEYMFYLVEHKVAAATGETPIAVMGEVRQFVEPSTIDSLAAAAAAAIPAPDHHLPLIGRQQQQQLPNHSTTAVSAAINSNQLQPQQQMPAMVTVTGGHSDGIGGVGVPVTMVKGNRAGEIHTIPINLNSGDGRQHVNMGSTSVQIMTSSNNTMSVAGGGAAPKTIVVVPVSATGDAGGASVAKKLKTSN